MRPLSPSLLLSLILLSTTHSVHAASAPPDTMIVPQPEIIISATRTPRDPVNIPNAATVITREELRRRGVHTFAEALQDLVGIDTGEGSDNGSRLPNVGMWGLKEFDALLFTLNGVPVGGPFNPSLSQISIDDIDRIEIVKGPQATMYGVSAFAGMVQVFTTSAQAGSEVMVGGGSFGQGQGSFSWGKSLAKGRDLRISGGFSRSEGWQDRTEGEVARGSATFGVDVGRGHLILDATGYRDEQDWGSPLPFDAGALVPGFEIDRNYAVGGAEVKHQVFAGTSRFAWPLKPGHRIENTLAVTQDAQEFLRSFPGEIFGDTLNSAGLELEPKEISLYEDLRWIGDLEARGHHEMVAGASFTWGETKGEGREFDFDQLRSQYPSIPEASTISDGEQREFEDGRRFLGVYLHDAWTPMPRLTLEGGGRFDAVSEELETEADLPSGPVQVKDKRKDSDFSGDASALVRLVPESGVGPLHIANLYGSVRRAFKPAAPNLAEAEAAEILKPEHTTSFEVGVKSRWVNGFSLDASYFDMTFKNLVVSILGSGGLPELTNAGEERFKGFEAQLRWTPSVLRGSAFGLGYAHHDARFVDFTFVTPDGQFRDVSGKKLELVPRELLNARFDLRTPAGFGGFV
ncbi:MAG: TonB-dependent receptor, partial [Candidatus Eisenbacteria bacterium]